MNLCLGQQCGALRAARKKRFFAPTCFSDAPRVDSNTSSARERVPRGTQGIDEPFSVELPIPEGGRRRRAAHATTCLCSFTQNSMSSTIPCAAASRLASRPARPEPRTTAWTRAAHVPRHRASVASRAIIERSDTPSRAADEEDRDGHEGSREDCGSGRVTRRKPLGETPPPSPARRAKMPNCFADTTAIDDELSNRWIDLDPAGYFLIKVDHERARIEAAHFLNTIDDDGGAEFLQFDPAPRRGEEQQIAKRCPDYFL